MWVAQICYLVMVWNFLLAIVYQKSWPHQTIKKQLLYAFVLFIVLFNRDMKPSQTFSSSSSSNMLREIVAIKNNNTLITC